MAVLPALSVLVMAVLAVLPWGGDDTIRFAIAMLPMTAIQYWGARRPQLLPVTLVFTAGLLLDVMSHGPLGFWALLALFALALGRLESAVSNRSTAIGRAAAYVCAMMLLATAAWAVASVYFNHAVEWRTMASGAALTVLLYPLLALTLMPIDRHWDSPRSQPFLRGR